MSDNKSDNPDLLNNLDALLNMGKRSLCHSKSNEDQSSLLDSSKDEADSSDMNLSSRSSDSPKDDNINSPLQQTRLNLEANFDDETQEPKKRSSNLKPENTEASKTIFSRISASHIEAIVDSNKSQMIKPTITKATLITSNKKKLSPLKTNTKKSSRPIDKGQSSSSSSNKRITTPSPFFSNPFDIIPDNVPVLDYPIKENEIDQTIDTLLNNNKKSIDDYAQEIEIKLREIAPLLTPKQRYLIINELIFVIDKISK